MEDWSFNSSKKRLATLKTAMEAISRDPLFWRSVLESLEFAQCSAHQRRERQTEMTLTRLHRLLQLAPTVDDSTPETVHVKVGQSAWERGQLETFARQTGTFYQQAIQTTVTTLRSLRDTIVLLPEASWLQTGMVEVFHVAEEMHFYSQGAE